MSNSSLPHAESWVSLFEGCFRRQKREEKTFRFYPLNPLKRLDSGERIQGNPRNSNLENWDFRSETVGAQENPNRAGPIERPGRRRAGAKPPLSKCKAVSCPGFEVRSINGERRLPWRTGTLMPQGARRSLASRRMLQKAALGPVRTGASFEAASRRHEARGPWDEMRRTSESGQ
jgi:hypothetical protein